MKINIATAPVSWGVLMKDTPNVPPYSLVLDQIRDAGYKGTELGPYGYLPFEITKLKDELAQRDLRLISAFTIFDFVNGKANETVYREALETIQVLSAMGCDYAVLSDTLFVVKARAQHAGRITAEESLDDGGWQQAAANVDAFARVAYEEYGLKCCVHPHVGGYLETPFEIDALLARTNPDLVGLCFDMAHIAYGGGDPVAVLDKWHDRTWYMHIKECDRHALQSVLARGGDYFDGVRAGVFPELGKGTIDWHGIKRILTEMNYQGWGTVEQDILPESGLDPLASAKRNRAFLHDELGW
ncbi:MAG: TIM barrel protein [Caldilineaceae bacterium]|nr:TIM barrel protein [Caldilineaceae bacterium]